MLLHAEAIFFLNLLYRLFIPKYWIGFINLYFFLCKHFYVIRKDPHVNETIMEQKCHKSSKTMEYGERQKTWLWVGSRKDTIIYAESPLPCFYSGKSIFVSGTVFCLVYFTSVASIKSAPVCSGIESSCLLCSNISHLGSWAVSQWQTPLSALVGNEHFGLFGCFPLDLVK